MMRNIAAILIAAGFLGQVGAKEYGVCAHVGGHEWHQREKVFGLAKEAGFAFVRADFAWKTIQKDADSWDYSKFDAVVADAKENGIKILPILDYSVPFADPAHEHLDLWLKYVSNTVVRYKSDVRCWEVWNEPNLGGFWRHPNPVDYVKLLRPTYELIKQIDPMLTCSEKGQKRCFNLQCAIEWCILIPVFGWFSCVVRERFQTDWGFSKNLV